MGDVDPGFGGGDGSVPVLGQPSAPSEPGEGPFHDPSTRQEFKALRGVRALDDLDRPRADPVVRGAEFRPSIAAVCEDVPEPRAGPADRGKHRGRAIAILDVGCMNHEAEQQAHGVDEGVAVVSRGVFRR